MMDRAGVEVHVVVPGRGEGVACCSEEELRRVELLVSVRAEPEPPVLTLEARLEGRLVSLQSRRTPWWDRLSRPPSRYAPPKASCCSEPAQFCVGKSERFELRPVQPVKDARLTRDTMKSISEFLSDLKLELDPPSRGLTFQCNDWSPVFITAPSTSAQGTSSNPQGTPDTLCLTATTTESTCFREKRDIKSAERVTSSPTQRCGDTGKPGPQCTSSSSSSDVVSRD